MTFPLDYRNKPLALSSISDNIWTSNSVRTQQQKPQEDVMKSGTKNPVAKSLRSPHLRMQVVPSKKNYCRKGRMGKTSDPSSF